nr:hypothetical protein [Tanacetum cinerariifolium]
SDEECCCLPNVSRLQVSVVEALIDGKRVVVSEDVIQQDLNLDDADGVECLPNEEIFTKLAHMGYEQPPPKLTFYKAFFSAYSRKFNFSKYIFDSMYTSYALTQKVFANIRRVEQDKIAQALEILKLKRRVKKLEKKEIKFFWFKEVKKGGKIEAIDADEDITLVDAETQVDMDVELQGRKNNDNAATKDMKAEKARLLDDQMAKRLHDEEVEQATAREKQERDDLEKAKGLQQHYDEKQENIDCNVVAEKTQEKHLDNIRKYQSLKRKPVSIAQARKNKIIYLKNMAGYKMEHFKREYNKVQTLFKLDKDVEERQKIRVAEETLLQESFKKLKAVEVSGSESTQNTPTNDPKEISKEDVKNMLEIVPVSKFKVEGLQFMYPFIDCEILLALKSQTRMSSV